MFVNWTEPESNIEDYFDGDIRYVCHTHQGGLKVSSFPFEVPENGHFLKIREHLSEGKKIILPIHMAYFHFLIETMASVISEIERADLAGEKIEILFAGDSEGILNYNDSCHINHVVRYTMEQIKLTGHKVGFLDIPNGAQARIKNFRLIKHQWGSLHLISKLDKFMKLGRNLEEQEPFRKIYLSRSKTLSNNVGFRATDEDYALLEVKDIRDKYQYKINDRIDDEKLLEDYLVELGFEIVLPEDITSYEDQIRLMVETKAVVSLTSAGLSSAIYMKPGGTIIELMTPLVVGDHVSLHTQYLNLAYEKRLGYAMIPHHNSAEEIINHIEGNPSLKEFLRNV